MPLHLLCIHSPHELPSMELLPTPPRQTTHGYSPCSLTGAECLLLSSTLVLPINTLHSNLKHCLQGHFHQTKGKILDVASWGSHRPLWMGHIDGRHSVTECWFTGKSQVSHFYRNNHKQDFLLGNWYFYTKWYNNLSYNAAHINSDSFYTKHN